jgi:hypothetical protein
MGSSAHEDEEGGGGTVEHMGTAAVGSADVTGLAVTANFGARAAYVETKDFAAAVVTAAV